MLRFIVIFENFRNMCLEIYELDPAKFLSAPGLACQAALKKTKVKLELLTDIDVLAMVEKGIRITNTRKIMIKIGMYLIYMDGQCRKSFQ